METQALVCSLGKRALECDEKWQLTQSWGNNRAGWAWGGQGEGSPAEGGQLPLSFRQCLPPPYCCPSVDRPFLFHQKALNLNFYGKSFHFTCLNHNEIPLYTHQDGYDKISKTESNTCWGGSGEIGTLAHGWWECKMAQQLWESLTVP